MSQRAELLALVQKHDTEAVVQFVKKAKQQAKDLHDTVAECSQRQREDLWESLRQLCADVLLDDKVEDNEEAEKRKKANHHAFLDCLVTLATATVQQNDVNLPQTFLDTAVLLHGVLLTLPDEIEGVKCRLAQLFESWWRRSLPGWEDIIANTLVYFLKRSLAKGTASDVKSVWRLHSVLMLVNFDTPGAADLKNLLGLCCSSVQYLRIDEGRRFLCYVFTLNTGLVDHLHGAIKNQIPYAPKSWLPLYGDVYAQAWQKSTGDVCQSSVYSHLSHLSASPGLVLAAARLDSTISLQAALSSKIEHDCIQDLMNHAVHASWEGPQPMCSTLFRVMSQFHRKKKQRGVDSMLLRLYNPILWRALTVPNTEVRANSARLLLDAFPLQDPNATAEETDALIQKQFDLMQRLLVDPCPVVRSLTVEGVSRVLSTYLEMIPAEVVQSLLCKLLKELAWDTASPSVRLAVVKGITAMLDNPVCHLLLKPLLSGLSLCLHDKAETVRVAMVDLLLKVKGIRSIRYWTICPIEHLLARLEEDSQPVVRRIVELLFPSFFPLDQNAQEQVSRCMTLIESNSSAARVFFLNAPRHLTLSDTVKYMALLCRYVLESVRSMNQTSDDSDAESDRRSQGRGGKKRRDNSTQEGAGEQSDDDGNDDDDNALTPEMLQGLLEAIFLMWTAVAKQLDLAEHADLKQSIMKKLSITVPEVLKVTQDSKVISLVMEIAGLLPPKVVPTISRGCLSKLRDMPEGSTEGDYTELLEAMCLWQMAPQILQLLSDWLEDSLTPAQPSPPPATEKKKAKPGKKCVQIAVPEEEKRPKLALDYLTTMLRSAICKRSLVNNHHSLLVKFNRLLSRVMVLLEKELEQEMGSNSERTTFLETVFSLHLRVTVLLHDPEGKEENGDAVKQMVEVIEWVGNKLMPVVLGDRDSGRDRDTADSDDNSTVGKVASEKSHVDLAMACVLVTLTIGSNMLMLGLGDSDFIARLVAFCRPLLNPDTKLPIVEQVLACLYQAVLFEELEASDVVSQCMSDVMVALNASLHRHCRQQSVDLKVLSNVRNRIFGVVSCITSRHGNLCSSEEKDVAIVTELTRTMLSAAVAELARGSKEDTLPEKIEDGQDALPPVSTCVLTCYTRNSPCRRLFLQEMESRVKSGAVTDIHTTHAIIHLLFAVQSKASYSKDMDLSPLKTAVSDLIQAVSQQTADNMDIDVDVHRNIMVTIQTKMQSIVGNPC